MSNKRINVRTSDKGVDARTSSRGQLGLENDDDCRLPSNDSNEQWTAYNTPSQTHEMGDVPISQHPMCLKTRNKNYDGLQMAVNSLQREPCNSSCSRSNIEQKLCHNDVVKDGHSKSNVKNKTEQMRRAVVLVDQRRMRPPPKVPRHSTSDERVDVETSSKQIDTGMSSRGHLGLENNDDRRFPGKDVSKRRTAYATPSQIRETGHLPVYRHPVCLKAHNEIIYGPQMAINSSENRLTVRVHGMSLSENYTVTM